MSEELDKIKSEIAALKQDYVARLDALTDKVDRLQDDSSAIAAPIKDPIPDRIIPTLNNDKIEPVEDTHHEWGKKADPWTQIPVTSPKIEKAISATKEKSADRQMGDDVVTEAFFAGASRLLGPFSSLIQPVIDLYSRYKKEEKLSVFFLTLGGILALVLGFGYVLQYSFNNLLNETAKIGLGFLASFSIIGLGGRLSSGKSKMHEYGASLIGLGTILTYLCIYFVSTFYGMVSPTTGFAMLGANTLVAYFLAIRYETRIVASISFIGGAFTPLFLGNEVSSPIFYGAYLLLLSATALHLSQKIRWSALALTSFIIVGGIFEYVILGSSIPVADVISFCVLIHIFFYLYVYFGLFDGLSLRATLDKQQILLVAGSSVFLLGNLYGLLAVSSALGVIYLINASPFLALIYPLKLAQTNSQRAILLLFAGSFIGFAIPVLFDLNIAGLIWGLEGIMLLYLGFQYGSGVVRKEGYLVLFVALAGMVQISTSLVSVPSLYSAAYVNLLCIGLLLWITTYIIRQHDSIKDTFDSQISQLFGESFYLVLAIAYFVTTFYFLSPYHLLLSVVPLFYLLYSGYIKELKYTQYLGYLHYGLILYQVMLSVDAVNSYRFTEQTLLGKIAIIEAFGLLAVLQMFYQKFAPESDWLEFAKKVRTLFLFLLPLVLLPTIFRRIPEWLPLALWGSTLASYFIASWFKQNVLRTEALLLYGLSTFYSLFIAYTHSSAGILSASFVGLCSGPLVALYIIYQERGFTRTGFQQSWCWPIITGWYLHTGLTVSLIILGLSGRLDVSMLLFGAYLIFISLKSESFPALRDWLRPFYLGGVGVLAALLVMNSMLTPHQDLIALSIALNVIALGLLVWVVRNSDTPHRLVLGNSAASRNQGIKMELWGVHLLTVMAYASSLYLATGDWLGPALTIAFVVHATTVLFLAINVRYKPLMPLAIALFVLTVLKIFANDLEGFSLIQKVMAFMIIGVVLLAAAYKFQRFRVAQEVV